MPTWLLGAWNSITSISSGWYSWLLALAGASHWVLCSWRRQWPALAGGTALDRLPSHTPASATDAWLKRSPAPIQQTICAGGGAARKRRAGNYRRPRMRLGGAARDRRDGSGPLLRSRTALCLDGWARPGGALAVRCGSSVFLAWPGGWSCWIPGRTGDSQLTLGPWKLLWIERGSAR